MRQTTVARLFLCVGLVAWVASCRGDEAQSPAGGASTLIINELVALNQAGLKDEDGDTSDWIELKNVGPESVNLSGWFLTDNAEVLDQWALPDVELAPGAFLIVFASGKDRRTSSAQLHTNFKLKSSGEYLALTRRTDRLEVVTEFSPSYGAQRADVAWGTHEEAGYHFLSPPTPWLPNSTSQVVPEPAQVISFSEPAGLHFGPITVSISGDGILHYTLDGSRPTIGSPVVDGPFVLEESTQVRVGVADGGMLRDVTSGVFIIASTELKERTSNLPMMVIDTLGDERVDDEDRPRMYRPSLGVVFDVDQSTGRSALDNAPVFAGRAGMHIRGNSTASYPKKQYSFETWDEADEDLDVALLGFPAESDWVLQAPFADKTLMRNHLMYAWSNRIGRYASRTKFIELYLNKDGGVLTEDTYVGVYVLMEKVKRDANRVNVESLDSDDKTAPAVTGGYILEKGWNFSEEVGIRTQRLGDELLFIYPKADSITSEQRAYLQGYLDDFEDALMGSDFTDPELGYEKYIDVDSFIDHHLMVEMARNIDGYVLSTFVHKPRGGKLTMGPIWDYNGALGNPDYFEGWFTEGWHYQNPEFPADNPNAYHWYERLMEDPAFRSRYAARWRQLRASHFALTGLYQDIDAAADLLGEAATRNFERWDILGDYVWPNAPGFQGRDSYQKEIDYMKDWLEQRLLWMDAELERP